MNTNSIIAAAIDMTKKLIPGYFESTLEFSLPGGAGNIFEELDGKAVTTVADLEAAIRSADWTEYDCPGSMDEGKTYRTSCKGRYRTVSLDDLCDDVELVLDDPKNTGFVSATARGQLGQFVDVAVLIIGQEQGEDVIYTIHPGDSLCKSLPSQVYVTDRHHGEIINVKTAKALGITRAKIIA